VPLDQIGQGPDVVWIVIEGGDVAVVTAAGIKEIVPVLLGDLLQGLQAVGGKVGPDGIGALALSAPLPLFWCPVLALAHLFFHLFEQPDDLVG
jgi:hypothetical protein